MMMMKKSVGALFLVVVAILVAQMHEAAAVDCNPVELISCAGAVFGGGNPSQTCCSNLKAQQPCFCSYLKNPDYAPYLNSPNAKNMVAKCGVTIPTC